MWREISKAIVLVTATCVQLQKCTIRVITNGTSLGEKNRGTPSNPPASLTGQRSAIKTPTVQNTVAVPR